MATVGSKQNVRLFLEGREVPFQSAVISSRVGVPTTANINLVPLKEIKFIKPRTQVHIFMQDTKNFPDNNFYLVFEGEVLGRARSKKQDSRSFSVSAVDYSSYWDDTKVYTMNPNFVLGKVEDVVTFQDAPIGQTTKALGGKTFTSSATSNTRVTEIILSNGNKDFVKGVVAVIKQLSTANQFYAAAFERLRISDRLNIFSGNKLQTFLQDLKVDEFLEDFTGKHGGIKSLRELLNNIMNLIFHDFVSIPFPSFVPPPTKTASGVDVSSTAPAKIISSFFFVPDCYSLPAPMCNVVFPNQQTGYDYAEDFRQFATRYMFRASFPLMTAQGVNFPQYPSQFFPTCFSDYMFGKKTAGATETASSLGPSTLLTDSKTGNSYANIFYGRDKKTAVGTAFGTVLRESDYLSNEESLKGIYLDMDTFMPSYTALVKGASPTARTAFIQAIGAYLFYKKRFSARQSSAQLLFNPYLVPGFNAVFLDDSEAGQSFIAKLQALSHTLTNDGCATSVELAYGRDFDELDDISGGSGDPPLPPWFDSSVFGTIDKTIYAQETDYLLKIGAIDKAEKAIRDKITNPSVYQNLNKFFQPLLGVNSITNFTVQTVAAGKTPPKPMLASVRGAVSWLLFQYRKVASNPQARDEKVRELTSRPLVDILSAFKFVRAQPVGYVANGRFKLPDQYAVFSAIQSGIDLPKRFDGTGYADEKAIQLRRSVINNYVKILKTQVGFRG